MTNQYIDQLPETVQQAIFGNVGTLGSFVVSQSDANILANEFAPMFSAEDLVALDAYSMYIKVCIDGMTSVPFSAKSLAPRYEPFGLKDDIINLSRENHGTSKEEIEDKVNRWSKQGYSDNGNRSLPPKDSDEDEKGDKAKVKPSVEKKDVKSKSIKTEGGYKVRIK
jgi:hypothetical protein